MWVYFVVCVFVLWIDVDVCVVDGGYLCVWYVDCVVLLLVCVIVLCDWGCDVCWIWRCIVGCVVDVWCMVWSWVWLYGVDEWWCVDVYGVCWVGCGWVFVCV